MDIQKNTTESRIFEEDFELVPISSVDSPSKRGVVPIFPYILLLLLVGFASYGLGKLSMLEKDLASSVTIQNKTSSDSDNTTVENQVLIDVGRGAVQGVTDETDENVVASKSGTKYHYPWCAGAKQIAEKNKITFNTIEEARAAGYTPAANCKGLK